MRNLIGVADGVKLSESAPFGLALGQSDTFFRIVSESFSTSVRAAAACSRTRFWKQFSVRIFGLGDVR
jgi:hypothetical protein